MIKRIGTLLLLIALAFNLTSCGTSFFKKEYNGKRISSITKYYHYAYYDYDDHCWMSSKDLIDFDSNKYFSGYVKSDELDADAEEKSSFSDEAEKEFMDLCYEYGLFDLEEEYTTDIVVDDGGGDWDFIIEYEDGTTKKSHGEFMAYPEAFEKCATVFYDLCRDGVVGSVPTSYIYPPEPGATFHYKRSDGTSFGGGNVGLKQSRVNYKWNKQEVTDADLFRINDENRNEHVFYYDTRTTLVLWKTYDWKEKFIRIKITEYDFNEELTNPRVIHRGFFGRQVEFDIEINKIYVYELKFANGDYVQYTINTGWTES